MRKYKVHITWSERGTNNAACIGNDEKTFIEATSAREACQQAAIESANFHDADWETGKYYIFVSAYNRVGDESHSIRFQE